MKAEQYKCQSYYDENNTIKDCSCGQCEVKIYGSTEYVERRDTKIGILKLQVISQWDFAAKTICFQTLKKTFGGGSITIPYLLERCIYVSEDGTHTRWEKVENLTQNIKDNLVEKGYRLSSLDKPVTKKTNL